MPNQGLLRYQNRSKTDEPGDCKNRGGDRHPYELPVEGDLPQADREGSLLASVSGEKKKWFFKGRGGVE